MTMQVGMVGTDGIVLASDTLWMHEDVTGIRHTSNKSKFRIDYERGIAISCARSMETAVRIADDLIKELPDEGRGRLEWSAVAVANRTLEQAHNTRKPFQCLIVSTKPKPQLFHLHYGVFDPAVQAGAACDKEPRRYAAGDQTNAACFWSERYQQHFPPQSIQRLIPLAAHLIVSASKLNSAAIGGLEIVVCDESGIHLLSDESTAALEAQSAEWDQQIGDLVMGYAKQFTYAPNVIG
jgi:hypothetical protein